MVRGGNLSNKNDTMFRKLWLKQCERLEMQSQG